MEVTALKDQAETCRHFADRIIAERGVRYGRVATIPTSAKTNAGTLRDQLAGNGATSAEIGILLDERVELNAMPSDALIAMIERKLKEYGLEKVIPDDDALLADTYCVRIPSQSATAGEVRGARGRIRGRGQRNSSQPYQCTRFSSSMPSPELGGRACSGGISSR